MSKLYKKKKFNSVDALNENHWPKLKLSKKKIDLEQYLSSRKIVPNFIKIDVDGDD